MLRRHGWTLLGALVLFGFGAIEIRTSALQSVLLSRIASSLTYRSGSGPSQSIVFPSGGPSDKRNGYTRLPEITQELEHAGYRISSQSRFSPTLRMLAGAGVPPPFRERPGAGLLVHDRNGIPTFVPSHDGERFGGYDEVPPLVVRSLLYMEDRDLADDRDPRLNPAVDWARLAKASALYAGHKLGMPGRVEGGSTLAVQMVKYRHGDEGLTRSPFDKLRQIAAASLEVYVGGPDTREARRQIVVEYLNSMPLAAAPHYGEVHGLREGLRVWFGLDPDAVCESLERPETGVEKARALKHVLALLYSVRAPSRFLARDHEGLEQGVNQYVEMLRGSGLLDPDFAEAVRATPLRFAPSTPRPPAGSLAERKGVNRLRVHLQQLLGATSLYDLDRLDLEVETTVDAVLQRQTADLFGRLRDPSFLDETGMRAPHLLATGDPSEVVYSLLLFESRPEGDVMCAHLDNLDGPFDLNESMKIELGSTAKLRTLAHYLELVARLHGEMTGLDRDALRARADSASDPLTRWAAEQLEQDPRMSLDSLVTHAMERTYSASPGEAFFTGGGTHVFHNFDPGDNGRRLTVREATVRSTNLVFIRLMRDLVRYHTARLPYDAAAVLRDPRLPKRAELLADAADEEARVHLARAWRRLRAVPPDSLVSTLLRHRGDSARQRAALFYAWSPGATPDSLGRWLATHGRPVPDSLPGRLARVYANPRFTLNDYAYLLGVHPLEIWCAGELARDPEVGWNELVARSTEVRRLSSSWLFQTRHLGAQNVRLRTRIERDAFERMTPDWRRLGFPFERLVPSYATALGNSSDRPAALAELMGIVLNEGVRRPPVSLTRLRFGSGTPYETVFEAPRPEEQRLLPAEVAHALRRVLAEVVDRGTAQRARDAVVGPDGAPLVVGGKTGSGDNRFKTVGPGGQVIASRAVSRTATFVFTLGDHHYGVITAAVFGPHADRYEFTSALPVSLLKLLAPALERHLSTEEPAPAQASRIVTRVNAAG